MGSGCRTHAAATEFAPRSPSAYGPTPVQQAHADASHRGGHGPALQSNAPFEVAVRPNVRYGRFMALRSVSDAELMERLTELFRSVGYEAASLSDIAAASGLQKSSLYGRFPGGKEQMAADVAAYVIKTFATDILAPLTTDQPLRKRVELVARNLAEFYRDGRRYCLLDTMTVGNPGSAALKQLSAGAAYWLKAFAAAAAEAGADTDYALRRAKDAVAAIEGSLVLARVTGDTETFCRVLDNLPETLLRGNPR